MRKSRSFIAPAKTYDGGEVNGHWSSVGGIAEGSRRWTPDPSVLVMYYLLGSNAPPEFSRRFNGLIINVFHVAETQPDATLRAPRQFCQEAMQRLEGGGEFAVPLFECPAVFERNM